MTKLSLILLISAIFIITSTVATHYGLVPSWQLSSATSSPTNIPDNSNFVTFVWNSVQFFIGMFVFQIAGLPAIFSLFWWLLFIVLLWAIAELIRGD